MSISVTSQEWTSLIKRLTAEQRYMVIFLTFNEPYGSSKLNSAAHVTGDYRRVTQFLDDHQTAGHLRRVNPAYFELTDAGRSHFIEQVGHLLLEV